MELILSRPSVWRTFEAEWRMKWSPAIISYSQGLKKKEIVELIANHEAIG